jgi:hypothetical protein
VRCKSVGALCLRLRLQLSFNIVLAKFCSVSRIGFDVTAS